MFPPAFASGPAGVFLLGEIWMIWLVAFAVTHLAFFVCGFGLGYAVCKWVHWRRVCKNSKTGSEF